MGSKCDEKEPGPGETLLGEWAENSSCNGVPNITRSHHPFRKVAWVILVLCGAAGTFYQVFTIIQKFYSYPVNINVNLTSQIQMEFPAVTVCNTNIVRKHELYRAKAELENILLYSFGSNDTSHLSNSYERQLVRFEFDTAFAQLDEATQRAMGHQKEDFIIDCSFNEVHCSHENFTAFINPRYGNCYTFNGDWRNPQATHRPGPLHGLTLELFIQQDDYVPELTEEAGVLVTMHHAKFMQFPEDEGVLAAPDMLTLIGMRAVRITRQKKPYPSDCWELGPEEAKQYDAYSELYGKYYSYLGCQKSCYQEHVMSDCHCSDPTYPTQAVAVRKNLSNPDANITPCLTIHELECEEEVKKQYLEGTLPCDCNVNCEELQYVPYMSLGLWPSEDFKEIYYEELAERNVELQQLVESWKENRTNVAEHIVKVKVFFEELAFEIITETPAYPWTTLLSDLGGSFGFYLGISVIALFEFVELLLDMCILGCKKCVKKDQRTSVTQVQPFQ